MAFDEALAERVRERLGGAPGVTEQRMFAGLGFLTHGNLTVAVRATDVLVRIDPKDDATAQSRPGVRPFVTRDRAMAGWIVVDAGHLDDAALDGWIAQARAFVATLPQKKPKK